jgi:transposase
MMAQCHVNCVHRVIAIMYIGESAGASARQRVCSYFINRCSAIRTAGPRKYLDNGSGLYIILLTHMRPPEADQSSRARDSKTEVLRRQGALHPHPNLVHDDAFRQREFFDARDLVQVRYEMLRRHQVDGKTVTAVAGAFGVSRQAFYTTEAAFEKMGISGLLPRRRGPQRAHKCTDEVLDFVEQWRPALPREKDVREAIKKRFGVSINPRSIERALARRKKKR